MGLMDKNGVKWVKIGLKGLSCVKMGSKWVKWVIIGSKRGYMGENVV